MTQPIETTPADLLGPLNEVEKKFAAKRLFYCGDTSLLELRPRVAIVGSREASEDGMKRARKLARLVVERGGVVVSGLAKGIDTSAHTSAIKAGGKTIAVIGTPLSQVYPKENTELQEFIKSEHLCVSQFPEGSKVHRSNFPLRNRTMALVSDATVILEAAERSGAISQGWEALRLGRGLFISKSLLEDPELSWPKEMAKYGAQVLSDDSIDEFFESLPVPCLPVDL